MCRFRSSGKLGESATTLIEVLVVLFICGVMCIFWARLADTSVKLRKVVRLRYKDNLTAMQTEHRIKQALSDLDSYPFFILPRVHKGGRVTLVDGRRVNFSSTPSIDSDALTAWELDMNHSYNVIRQEGMSFYVCPRYKRTTEHNFGYLGIGLDGMFELQGEAASHLGRIECLDMNLKVVTGMMLEKPELSETIINVIVPIKSYYTIYVDNKHQMRYLSHQGAEISENQPLFNNIRKLTLHPKILWSSIFCLVGSVQFVDEREKEFSFCNRLGRYNYLNFLMNKI